MIEEATTHRLLNYQKTIRNNGIDSKTILIQTGTPFDKIIAEADRLNVNVIMIGSGDISDDKNFRLGTTAVRLIRKSDKPVWVVKKGAKPQIKKLLCPVDLSEPSKRALSNAIHLARKFEAKLSVLTVVPKVKSLYSKTPELEIREQMQHEYFEKLHTEFENFLKDFNFHNVQWEKKVLEGTPYQEIMESARTLTPDLLIMGSTGRTGLSRILLGSTAEKIIRKLPCSVITVKSEHLVRLNLEAEIADIETHYLQGKNLLDQGFPEHALIQFEYCLKHDVMFVPAWEGMAAALEQLGDKKEAEIALTEARIIRERLWPTKV
jgi:nucleotide-binding universal stress UspA family protein